MISQVNPLYRGPGLLKFLLFWFLPKFNITLKIAGNIYVYRYVSLLGKVFIQYDVLILEVPEMSYNIMSNQEGNA